MRFDSPRVLVHPVVWGEPNATATSSGSTQAEPVLAFVDATAANAIDIASVRVRIDLQEQTLAELTQMRAGMSQTLGQLRGIIQVLAGRERLQAGLHVCALRRELEELAETHRRLQQDLSAAREEVAPAVRLASGAY